MKYSYIAAALAVPSIAAPTKRQSTNIDATVLQFALTLEHLENVFYKQAIQRFSQDDFVRAGYSANYYNNLKYIASDEESHVKFLTTALTAAGAKPVAACTYNFPYTDVNSFLTLSSVLEGVGTSAYLGGAPLITSKAYLTAAGSILVAEALHTSLQRGAVNSVPFASPYGTPLDPTSVFTLAASFITSCPPANAALPFKPFPAATLKTVGGTCEQPNCNGTGGSRTMAATRQNTHLTLTASGDVPAGAYITFVSGLNVVSVRGNIVGRDITAEIPTTAAGQVYTFITRTNANGTLAEANVAFGPAIAEIYPANAQIDFSYQ